MLSRMFVKLMPNVLLAEDVRMVNVWTYVQLLLALSTQIALMVHVFQKVGSAIRIRIVTLENNVVMGDASIYVL